MDVPGAAWDGVAGRIAVGISFIVFAEVFFGLAVTESDDLIETALLDGLLVLAREEAPSIPAPETAAALVAPTPRFMIFTVAGAVKVAVGNSGWMGAELSGLGAVT